MFRLKLINPIQIDFVVHTNNNFYKASNKMLYSTQFNFCIFLLWIVNTNILYFDFQHDPICRVKVERQNNLRRRCLDSW